MDEPTKEAIEEARRLRKEIGQGVLTDPRLTTLEEADLEIHRRTAVALAAVRKKARDDALEGAAKLMESYYYEFSDGATGIRAMKDQPSGEQP